MSSPAGHPLPAPRWLVLLVLWLGLALLGAAGFDWLAYSNFILVATGAG